MRQFKWLYPGMRVKRWIGLLILGILLTSAALSILFNQGLPNYAVILIDRVVASLAPGRQLSPFASAGLLLFSGIVLIVTGVRQTVRSITGVFIPDDLNNLVDLVFERRQLQRGPSIVAIGGGTGLSTMLRGLKEYSSNITAIVTVADDGGSSGRLREELGILPPGDIRNIITALADTEPLMKRLFQHRFTLGEGLTGHSFGNLFIAAMTEITGDFEKAIRESSKVLAVKGRILPSTLEPVVLEAEFEDGSTVRGESEIPRAEKRIRRLFLHPKNAQPVRAALQAIAAADAIILGPGSLYTSILPNLLIKEIADAVCASQALKIYVCNIMTQPGETTDYKASDHVKAIIEHAGNKCIDYVIVNAESVPREKARKYEAEGAFPVVSDFDAIRRMGLTPIAQPLLSEENLLRHDPVALAKTIMTLIIKANLKQKA